MGGVGAKFFNLQRFCTHDGPGIRTVVFFKGCPLRCQWCSNPESQEAFTELFFDAGRCIGCGRCFAVCPRSIPLGGQGRVAGCLRCGACAEVCPSQALESVGRDFDLDEIMAQIARDEAYYYPNGGVTLSGGEPLMHPEAVCKLADAVKTAGYHLALETTGFAPWDIADRVFSKCGLILYDLKHMDDGEHRRLTGVSNRVILENAARAAEKGYPLLIRVPLMGGLNDSAENISCLAEFCARNGLRQVEFLPYHTFGASKYALLGRTYTCGAETPSLDTRERLAAMLEAQNISVKLGV